MKQSRFPEGWNDRRVREVLAHYEAQTEDEAVSEDEDAVNDQGMTIMEVPADLVPEVRELIAKRTN